MDIELTILGTSAALPGAGRSLSSQILQYNNRSYLIDCGEGTQFKLLRKGLLNQRLRQIFISHIHGDHHYGLAGLISSSTLLGREEPLEIFGPAELEVSLRLQLGSMGRKLPFPLIFYPTSVAGFQPLFSDHQFNVWSFPLRHRVPTTGFLFREHPRQRHINPEAIARHDIPISQLPSLKLGKDFYDASQRRHIPNKELTFDPPVPRLYAYCSDTAYVPELAEWIKGVDLLFHETTFDQAEKERAAQTGHSTSVDAAQVALDAGAGTLITGHYSARYESVETLLREAQEVFPNTLEGMEGKTYRIPFKSRGEL